MSIITGRGDSGETDLLSGMCIAKTSRRIEALGCVPAESPPPRIVWKITGPSPSRASFIFTTDEI